MVDLRGSDILDELEFVLRKIIEIDNKAIDLQNRTEQTIHEQETLLNDQIKNLDEELNKNSKKTLEREVQKKVANAHSMVKSINTELEEEKQNIKNKYAEIKDVLKWQIFNEIIKIN